MKRKLHRQRAEFPPSVEARPATHFRPHAFETDSKPKDQGYTIPCGSATSSTRRGQLELSADAPEGAPLAPSRP
jgi:hypothetical protein